MRICPTASNIAIWLSDSSRLARAVIRWLCSAAQFCRYGASGPLLCFGQAGRLKGGPGVFDQVAEINVIRPAHDLGVPRRGFPVGGRPQPDLVHRRVQCRAVLAEGLAVERTPGVGDMPGQ